jgi:hypothetical protein
VIFVRAVKNPGRKEKLMVRLFINRITVIVFTLFSSLIVFAAQPDRIIGRDINGPARGYIAVDAEGGHSLALRHDKSIAAWGSNKYGESNVPYLNADFIAVAAGARHCLGLKQDGSIAAWGSNEFGQCNIPSPNTGFVAIAAGTYHSLGVKQNGSIVAWGLNSHGECNIPSPNVDFQSVAGGQNHSIGLKKNGSIAIWGDNSYGQLDVPLPIASNIPPNADAGFDQTIINTDNSGRVQVTLDGSGSKDSDGSIISYMWMEGGVQIATGIKPTLSLPVGTHTIALRVTDDKGLTDTDTVIITVEVGNS